MRGLRNRGAVVWCVAAMLAGAAHARASELPNWLDPEATLQKGREALFENRYAAAARLCTAVYLEYPSNAEARRCLREAALAGASEDVLAVQAEGGQIIKSAEKSRRVDELIKERGYLEAYDVLYGALEADHLDAWARGRLTKLQRAVSREAQDLGLEDERSRKAVRGFYEMTSGKWPRVLRAREHWFAALALSGAEIPEVRIRRYLARIERQEKRQGTGGAQVQPVSNGSPKANEIYLELDEFLK